MNLKQRIWIITKLLLIIIGIFLAVYIILNAPALWKKFNYWYTTKFKQESWPESYQVVPVNLKNNLGYILTPTHSNQNTNNSVPNNNSNVNANSEVVLDNNYLYIPKLGIRAPVNWEVSESEAIDKLQTGVVHLRSTGLPGTDGNIFISGHSSYYWWDPGQYKTIFALLPNIANDDIVYITYNNVLYTYQVIETITVNPGDTWVMDKLNFPAVSLMTCVPVGTNLQRFIVRAKQISPNTSQEKPKEQKTPTNKPNLLPFIF